MSTISGDSGNNTLTGTSGDDLFEGFAGVDTAVIDSLSSDAVFSLDAQGRWVVTSSAGQDTLSAMELVRFNDGLVSLGEDNTRVNSVTASEQQYPAVTGLSDGGYVVTWTSYLQDGSGWGIYAKRYAADGTAPDVDTRVNTVTASDQFYPAVTGLSDGGYVVTWMSNGQDGSGWGIYARRYAADGTAAEVETRVNTVTASEQQYPAVTGLSDGGFVVTWTSYLQDGSDLGIYAKRYAADGTAPDVDTRVNTVTAGRQVDPTVTGLSDGGYVVTWTSYLQDGSDFGIYAKRYAADGTAPDVDTRVNTVTADRQVDPAVTGLSDGGYVVTWTSYLQDGSGYGIYARRYAADGTAAEVETRVNTVTASEQQYPAVTGLSDGGYVVTWTSYLQDGSGWGIYAKRYAADGTAPDVDTRVNTVTASDQFYPAVTGLSDGGYVVTWMSNGQDGSGWGIYAQRFDANGMRHGHLTLTGDDQDNVLRLNDSAGLELIGAAGDDTLAGGSGSDLLTGGTGRDTFDFAASGNGVDLITDWEAGDSIKIAGASFSGSVTAGTGSAIGQNEVQVSSLDGVTALYIGTNTSPGADVIVRITGTHQANSFALAGDLIQVSNINDPPTGSVTISGTPTQGQTLTAANTLADADGLGTIGYQWRADGTDIAGATGSTLLLGQAQVGQSITVVASYTDGGGTAESVASSATAPVADANDPPVLDPSGSPSLPTILENATNPAGITIAALVIDGSITDADGAAVEAVAIEAVDTSLGSWQYSLDGGVTWLSVRADLLNSTTNTLGLLLGPTDMLRLLPFGDLNGTLTNAITFRAWDMSAGSAGDYVVTTPGTGAFSSASDTASLTVSAVNDAPTFAAGTGKLLQPVSSSFDFGYSIALQADGKLVVAGQSPSGSTYDFSVIRLNSDGSLDNTFSTDGKLLVPVGTGADYARSVIVQPDGKILVAGYSASGSASNFGLIRLNADGSLDLGFGTNGKLTVPMDSSDDRGFSVTLQPDGKIVVADSSSDSGSNDFAVVRYTADGTLDVAFDGDGKLVTDFGSATDDLGYSVAIQPDGKIVVAGHSDSGGSTKFAVARYNTDGSLDNSFDGDGKVVAAVGSADIGQSVIVQSDGKILVAGRSWNGSNWDFGLLRLNANGSLDSSFDGDGKLLVPVGSSTDEAFSVTLQPDGKIVVAGFSLIDGNNEFSLIRLNANGSLDTSFDADGKVLVPVGSGTDISFSVTIQPDGKIVVAGHSLNGSDWDFSVVRLNADGSLDTTFNGAGGGTLAGAAAYTENAAAVALDSNVLIFDAELAALGGGAGNYDGANITLSRTGGANAQDVFSALGSLTFTAGNAVLSGVTVGTVSNSGGQLTIAFNANATQARVNEVLSSIGYANSSDAPPSSVQISWTFSDGNSGSQGDGGTLAATGITTVSITAANDPPVLDPSGSPSLPTMLENATNPAGITIAALIIDGSITDADGAAVEAIAIEAVDTSLGTWQYSLDGGTSWLTIRADLLNSSTNTLGLLLGPTNMVRLLPFGDLNGTLTNAITFRAWDMSAGSAGDYVVTTPGADAFSSASDTASLTVSAVNDAPTFSPVAGSGKLMQPVGNDYDIGASVAVQPDGKIIVAGYSANDNEDFSLIRLNADGSLDTSFSADGKLLVGVGSDTDTGWSVALQPDGKIVMAGYGYSGGADFGLIRLNADGSLDETFSSDGKVLVPVGSGDDFGYSVTLQPDGKIVVAGNSSNGADLDFSLIRLNADGSLDETFSSDGRLLVPVGDSIDQALSVVSQPDGKILVAGLSNTGSSHDFSLIRVNADGSMDTSFDADGKLLVAVGSSHDQGFSVALQPDGKILVSGLSYSGGAADFGLIRLNADGSLDTTFDGDGKLVVPVGSGTDSGYGVTVQTDGKILVAGSSHNGTNYDFSLIRVNADGSLDTSFGTNGKLLVPVGSSLDEGLSVAVQPDGKIVVAGYSLNGSNEDFSVIRLNVDGSLDTRFNGTAVNTLGGTVAYTENAAAVALDSSVAIYDVDLADLGGGVGNYEGSNITLSRTGGANAQDLFSAMGSLTFTAGNAVLSGVTVGTVSNSGGQLTIAFNANATQARVNEVLSSIGYANSSDAPPSSIQVTWLFSDGNTGSQGTTGGALTATGTTTVNITSVNDAATIAGGASAVQFADAATYDVNTRTWPVGAVDLNEDGHLDVVTANATGLQVLLGDGTGALGAPTNWTTNGNDPLSIAIGDFNADGHQDVVVALFSNGAVAVMTGDGAGGFSATSVRAANGTPETVRLNDLDNDGDLDIVTANYTSGTVSVLRGDGLGGFAVPSTYGVSGAPTSVAIGDFNEDGIADLVTSNHFSGNVSMLAGDGLGGFASPVQWSTGGAALTDVEVADLNGDSHLDIVTGNRDSNNVSLLFGTGAGTFSAPVTRSLAGDGVYDVMLTDMTGDGALDIVTANWRSDSISLLAGDGFGGFSTPQVFGTLGDAPIQLAIADLNNDSLLDVVTGDLGSNEVSVLLQTGLVERADGTADENTFVHSISGTLAFSDADIGDSHTVNVAAASSGYRGTLSAGIAVDSTGGTGGVLQWSFSALDSELDDLPADRTLAQTYELTLDDGAGGIASRSLRIALTGSNDAPVLAQALPDVMVAQNQPINIAIPGAFTDVDSGDNLVLAARLADGSALPSWLAFDASTATFNGMAPAGFDLPVLAIEVTATDTAGASASDEFRLEITPAAATPGDDVLYGTPQADTIDGLGGNDSIHGGSGNDTLYGNFGNDTLVGGDGDDLLAGQAGVDVLTGGAGVDQYNFSMGDGNGDRITDYEYDEKIFLYGAPDDLEQYRLRFDGTDSYLDIDIDGVGDFDMSIILLGPVNGLLSLTQQTGGSDVYDVITIAQANAIYGSQGNDTIAYAGTDPVAIFGLRGDDSLDGGSDNDTIYGGSGNDTLTGGLGSDTVVGGLGADRIVVNGTVQWTAADVVDGTQEAATRDTLVWNNVVTTVTLNASNIDVIELNGSINTAGTITAATVATADYDQDGVSGDLYVDLNGSGTVDVRSSSGQRVTIDATSSSGGFLLGGAGFDTILGGSGTETIYGREAADVLSGGLGGDIFWYFHAGEMAAGESIDGVLQAGTLDRIEIFNGGSYDFNAVAVSHIDEVVIASTNATALVLSNAMASTADANGDDTLGDLMIRASAALAQIVTVDGSALLAGTRLVVDGANLGGSDSVTGGAGDDTLNGGAGNDTLIGRAGNDVIRGWHGNDTLEGGDGDDTLWADSEANNQFGTVDVVNGGDGNDFILGGFGNATLIGGAGSDNIVLSFASTSSDTVEAGADGDLIQAHAQFDASDRIDGGAGTDTLTMYGDYSAGVQFGAQTLLNVERWEMAGGGSKNFTTHDATVAAGQTLTVVATALGASESLMFNGSAESDGAFIINAGASNDTLVGGAGNDALTGGAGNDLLAGGIGADILDGGLGIDAADYSTAQGNAQTGRGVRVNLANGKAEFSDAEGDQLLGIENLIGSAFDDTLVGDAVANRLQGGSGNDTLNGGTGADVIYGGTGNDILSGNKPGASDGAGDTFVFNTALNAATNVDSIWTLEANALDKIALDLAVFGAIAGSATTGLDATEFRSRNGGDAMDGNDFIIYDPKTGNLFYDADGNGAAAKVLFANLVGIIGTPDYTDFTTTLPLGS